MKQEGYNGFAAPHNVGMDHTDQPNSLANPRRKPEPLKFAEGSVFTIDVPYLEIGYGSSHVEDMMVCTKDGAVPLSSGDRRPRGGVTARDRAGVRPVAPDAGGRPHGGRGVPPR